jgi:hypothetical protein
MRYARCAIGTRIRWTLDNRSLEDISKNILCKGQTGQQLLLGAYSAMNRQIGRGKIKSVHRHEMQDLVVIDKAGNYRDLVTGEIERHSAHAVVVPLEDTEMYFSYLLTRWVVMQLLLGK